jgi:hypothetical protein
VISLVGRSCPSHFKVRDALLQKKDGSNCFQTLAKPFVARNANGPWEISKQSLQKEDPDKAKTEKRSNNFFFFNFSLHSPKRLETSLSNATFAIGAKLLHLSGKLCCLFLLMNKQLEASESRIVVVA